MKHLKKISREDLKSVNGGKRPAVGIGNCGNACSSGDGFCEQFGLSCYIHVIESGDNGQITSTCWKCS
ncbi:bacteriocin-like protein [Chryseobacterium herbae]|uniref:Bacteriocin-like protein n=1 Tax=Chryseobacterium herbae TaxID=2976476 RepID=A0ABT2IYJ7_9FLAO|nr:hypothetical protein [Chryseobacterium sp. pc1-10]MCT2563918.1 hypothetical protein [Chryseobacterium sp. pc1-10]